MGRLTGSPTVTTVGVLAVVFLCQKLFSLVGLGGLFALSLPLVARPWTIVTSVYAHDSLAHLLVNTLGLALGGLLVERVTTSARFYGFFLAVGAVAGVMQVTVLGLFGARVSVLGASGAILGLYGYLLGSNRLTEALVAGVELSARVQVVLWTGVAAVITLLTANPEAALVAHFTGLVLGLFAGRVHLLAPRGGRHANRPTAE